MTTETHEGPMGTATLLDINPKIHGAATTVTWWLLQGGWHPAWSQFVLAVVSLRDVDGYPPAKLHYPGATHELQVLALDPGNPPRVHSVPELVEHGIALCGYLQPIDVIHQFIATDDEMTELAELLARACVDGMMTPSTDDAREAIRQGWLSACVKTLAHMRGEEHAK